MMSNTFVVVEWRESTCQVMSNIEFFDDKKDEEETFSFNVSLFGLCALGSSSGAAAGKDT